MNLYSKHAQDFSNTRQAPWKGWFEILKYIPDNAKILDIGCGNGRFLQFLEDQDVSFQKYIGIDSSPDLLTIASNNLKFQSSSLKRVNFLEVDVEEADWSNKIDQQFDIIVAFGLVHHIHTLEQRVQLFQSIESLLIDSGVAIVTLWQFDKSERFASKIIKDLGNNDYTLSFGNNGATRFVHFTDEPELRSIINQTNLERIHQFESDGKEEVLNKYCIFKKKIQD